MRCFALGLVLACAPGKLPISCCQIGLLNEPALCVFHGASIIEGSDPVTGHIISTTIGGKNGEPKRVYHCSFTDDDGITKACGCPLLSLKTHIKGPAPASDSDKADIVDEAITFFRANVFFKNFHVKSPADKLLIYLTSYINIALKRLEGCRTLAVGTKAIINLGLEKVPVPGEPGFPFPGLFALPQSQEEAELLRNYLKQIREETSGRLLNCAYRTNGTPNKWWLAFAKRKFMNIVIL